jgi:uncharacterized membrane protein YozB (DUF420 family)
MSLTGALNRNGVLLFLGLGALVVWGFWNSYFRDPLALAVPGRSVGLVHVHAAVMSLWCALLVAQAVLIRTGRRALHRTLGSTSFVLAPLVAILQLAVIRNFVSAMPVFSQGGAVTPAGAVFMAYTLLIPVIFLALFGLALAYRRDRARHARLMVCTAAPILGAATDRITSQYLQPLIPYLPATAMNPGGFPTFVGFALGDAVLLALAVWDWRSHRRLDVFPGVLLVLLAYQAFTMRADAFPWWRAVCSWYLGQG